MIKWLGWPNYYILLPPRNAKWNDPLQVEWYFTLGGWKALHASLCLQPYRLIFDHPIKQEISRDRPWDRLDRSVAVYIHSQHAAPSGITHRVLELVFSRAEKKVMFHPMPCYINYTLQLAACFDVSFLTRGSKQSLNYENTGIVLYIRNSLLCKIIQTHVRSGISFP